jgi:hypothetical protein
MSSSEVERDGVNNLPELWDIDRAAGHLSVSKHFVSPPVASRVPDDIFGREAFGSGRLATMVVAWR